MAIFLYAQQPGQDSGPPNQQEPTKQREVTPLPRQPEVNPPRGQEETKPPKRPPEAKPPKTEKQEVPPPQKEQPKSSHEQQARRPSKGRPAQSGKSAHIPDPQFKANFGRPHTFTVNRVTTTTTIVPNQTQVVFVGYTFIFLDPWPADWLLTDQCFIDEVGEEYFLFDVLHPGTRVALFVVG